MTSLLGADQVRRLDRPLSEKHFTKSTKKTRRRRRKKQRKRTQKRWFIVYHRILPCLVLLRALRVSFVFFVPGFFLIQLRLTNCATGIRFCLSLSISDRFL